jgi:serine/threonine-protein kinase
LAFDPDRRYADAAEFSMAIAGAVAVPPGGTPVPETLVTEGTPSEESAPLIARAGQTAAGVGPFEPELLREIERDLAVFIGPVASIVLRRAARQANDLVGLYELLGKQVESPRDRAEFLARGQRLAAAASDRPLPSAPPGAVRNDTGRRPGRSAVEARPANILAIETSLTRYIGPIARILIKKELEKFETLDKFYLVLAAHIPDERDRRAFLNARGTS